MSATDDQSQRLGNYKLLTRIAQGGMADIFLARQTGLGGLERVVVIKRIKPEYAEDPAFVEMFLREARIVARINDPNVVRIFELGEEGGTYFISMEYIHGLTLAELVTHAIEASTWLPLEASVAIIEQACKGLHQVHEVRDLDGDRMGLIHRDVSHQNFLCTEDGFVKLIDFGIAKSTESDQEATYSGNLKGKYAYMSPEQCRREKLDRRSDVFSLGIVAWELFSGQRLFKCDDKLATIEAITDEAIPPPSIHNPRLPERIDRTVMRALERDPTGRYQTTNALRSALLDATARANMEVDRDQLGNYVTRLAGDRLDERRRELRQAVDRQAETDLSDQIEMGDLESRSGEERSSAETWLRRTGAIGPVVLFVVAASLLAATAWYVLADGNGEPLTIGWAPDLDASRVAGETAPLRKYLGRRLQRPIRLEYAARSGSLVERLQAGRLDYAMLSAPAYLNAHRAGVDLDPVVLREFDGEASVQGLIVVPEEAKIESFDALKGRRICMTDRSSPSGNVLVRTHLDRLGHDLSFFGPIQWSGTPERVLRDLGAGRCAAGASSRQALAVAHSGQDIETTFRTVASLGRFPGEALVAGPHASPGLTDRLRRALLAVDPAQIADAAHIGQTLRISGFAPVDDDDYDRLRKALEATKQP